jgi:hypothetical protein
MGSESKNAEKARRISFGRCKCSPRGYCHRDADQFWFRQNTSHNASYSRAWLSKSSTCAQKSIHSYHRNSVQTKLVHVKPPLAYGINHYSTLVQTIGALPDISRAHTGETYARLYVDRIHPNLLSRNLCTVTLRILLSTRWSVLPLELPS